MRILGWTMEYWNDEAHSRRFDGKWNSLVEWSKRMRHFFNPVDIFVASGTWSDPRFCPINVRVVNAGAPHDKPYDYHCNHYACCAFSAALFYALDRNDWDFLVVLDTDAWVGEVNFPALFTEFSQRPQTMIAPGWNGGVGGPFMAWKRQGVIKAAHSRLYPNLTSKPRPVIFEMELRDMFGSDWWNPWPQHNTLDMAHDSGANPIYQDWPFVSHPHDQFRAEYLAKKTSKAVPIQ